MIEDAGYSAKDLKRPGVQAALEVVRRGGADALVVAKLDRLTVNARLRVDHGDSAEARLGADRAGLRR